MPPRGRPTLVVLSPCRFFLCRVALLCLVLRRRRRLPIPCSRCFSRLSSQLCPPRGIFWPLEFIELSSRKDDSSDAHCDHLPQANGNLNSFAGPHRLKVQEMLSVWKPPGLATGLSGSALGPGRRAVAAPAGGLQRRPARAYARRRRLRTTPSAARPNEERENEERHAVREGDRGTAKIQILLRPHSSAALVQDAQQQRAFVGCFSPGCTATTGIRRLL